MGGAPVMAYAARGTYLSVSGLVRQIFAKERQSAGSINGSAGFSGHPETDLPFASAWAENAMPRYRSGAARV